MNKKKNQNKKSEEFLKEMLQHVKEKETKPDFTEMVMMKIEALPNEEKSKIGFFNKYKFWIVFLLTFSVIIILNLLNLGSGSSESTGQITEYLRTIFSEVNIDYTLRYDMNVFMIIVSIVSLILIDKLLKIRKKRQII